MKKFPTAITEFEEKNNENELPTVFPGKHKINFLYQHLSFQGEKFI